MANRTDPLARAVHGTNPQNLIEKILRMKIYGARYWKEDCFGLSAETLVDKAMDLSHVGGTYGGNRKPTKLICLMLKLLQLQPEKEIIIEFIKNEEYKYVRALGAFYLRLVGKPADIYQYLEPLYNDYRKLRFREIMGWKIVHMDEFIDGLLRDEYCCDLALPHLPKRQLLEDALMLEPRRSALEEDWEGDDDDLDAEDEEEEEELDEDDVRKYVEARYNKMAIGSGDGADGGKDGSDGKKKSRREEERGDRGREKDRDRDRDRKKDPDDARRRRPASRSRSRERARGGRGDARRSRSRDRERGGRRGDRDRDRDRQGRDDRDRGERRRRRRSRSRSGSPRERRRGGERERVRDGDRRRRSSSRDRDRDRRERKKERAKEGRRAERAQEKLFGKKGGGGGKEEEEGGGGGEVGKEGDTEYWNDMRAKLGLKPLK